MHAARWRGCWACTEAALSACRFYKREPRSPAPTTEPLFPLASVSHGQEIILHTLGVTGLKGPLTLRASTLLT